MVHRAGHRHRAALRSRRPGDRRRKDWAPRCGVGGRVSRLLDLRRPAAVRDDGHLHGCRHPALRVPVLEPADPGARAVARGVVRSGDACAPGAGAQLRARAAAARRVDEGTAVEGPRGPAGHRRGRRAGGGVTLADLQRRPLSPSGHPLHELRPDDGGGELRRDLRGPAARLQVLCLPATGLRAVHGRALRRVGPGPRAALRVDAVHEGPRRSTADRDRGALGSDPPGLPAAPGDPPERLLPRAGSCRDRAAVLDLLPRGDPGRRRRVAAAPPPHPAVPSARVPGHDVDRGRRDVRAVALPGRERAGAGAARRGGDHASVRAVRAHRAAALSRT